MAPTSNEVFMVGQVVHEFRRQAPNVNDVAGDFRSFVIAREDSVDIPGCLSVEEVRLNGFPIPEYEVESVLSDLTRKKHHDVSIALWKLVPGPSGPILLRGTKSNDGNWQKGSILSVKGTWDESAEVEKRSPGRPKTNA